MTTVYKWRLYNINTGQYEEGWSDVKPTRPFSDPTHNADPDSIVVIETIDSRTVAVQQPFKNTGGYFMCEGKTLNVPAGQSASITYSYPIPIVALNMKFHTDSTHNGDVMEVYGDDPVVGILGANASIGATEIVVSPTVLANAFVGANLIITDGVNQDNLGRIISIDTNASTVEVENATTHAFAATSPTYVKLRVYFIKNYTIGPAGYHAIGNNVVGGASLPANTVMRVVYQNNGISDKVIKLHFEYLY